MSRVAGGEMEVRVPEITNSASAGSIGAECSSRRRRLGGDIEDVGTRAGQKWDGRAPEFAEVKQPETDVLVEIEKCCKCARSNWRRREGRCKTRKELRLVAVTEEKGRKCVDGAVVEAGSV
jgi:hypothetical protein